MDKFDVNELSTQGMAISEQSKKYNNYNFTWHKWQSEIDDELFQGSGNKETNKLNRVDILKEQDSNKSESKAGSSDKKKDLNDIKTVDYESNYRDYNFRTNQFGDGPLSNADKGMGFLDSMPREKQSSAEDLFYAIVENCHDKVRENAEKALTPEEKCNVHRGAIQFLFDHRK